MTIPPYPSRIPKIVDGESVEESIANRAPDGLSERTDHLKARLDLTKAGQTLVLPNVPVADDVVAGNLVYRDTADNNFQKGLAALEDVPSATTGLIEIADSSFTWGILLSKEAGFGDILLAGILPSTFSLVDTIEDAQVPGGGFAPGAYFLSSVTPGKATKAPKIAGLFQFFLADDGSARVLPAQHGILEAHIHQTLDLIAEPAGLANCVDDVDDIHVITQPDSSLPGWLPADDPVFGTAAPAGAKFGYNVAKDASLSKFFPPTPLEGAFLVKNGAIVTRSDVIIDNSGIWWLDDSFGNVPWPVDIDECDLGGGSSSSTPGITDVELQIFMTEFLTKTGDNVVTRLRLVSGEQNIKLLNEDGSVNTTGLGSMRLGLDLNLTAGAQDLTGPLVVKEVTDNEFKRGPVVEKIVAGPSGNIVVSNQDPSVPQGQGTVQIELAPQPPSPEESNLRVVATSPSVSVLVQPGSLWYHDGSTFIDIPTSTLSPVISGVSGAGKTRYDLLVLNVEDLLAAAPTFLEVIAGGEVASPGDPFDDSPAAVPGKLSLAIIKIDELVGLVNLVDADITNLKTLNRVLAVPASAAEMRTDGLNAAGVPADAGSLEVTGAKQKFVSAGHSHPTNTSGTTPVKDGVGTPGTATTYARADHEHPRNTDPADPLPSGTASPGVSGAYARADHVHPEGAGDASTQDHVVSGYTMPATDPDLTINVSPGTAFINNKKIVIASPTPVTLDSNDTNHIFLTDSGTIVANTTDTPPANSTKLGRAITDATTVTSTINGDRERSPYTSAAALELIERKDITSPVTSVTFLDIFGERDKVYKLVAHVVNTAGAAQRLDLRPNGITSNQRFKDLIGGGTGTSIKIGSMAVALEEVLIDAIIAAETGKNRVVKSTWNNPSASMLGDVTVGVWEIDQSTEITSLVIASTKVNGIAAGSFFSLYRVRQ